MTEKRGRPPGCSLLLFGDRTGDVAGHVADVHRDRQRDRDPEHDDRGDGVELRRVELSDPAEHPDRQHVRVGAGEEQRADVVLERPDPREQEPRPDGRGDHGERHVPEHRQRVRAEVPGRLLQRLVEGVQPGGDDEEHEREPVQRVGQHHRGEPREDTEEVLEVDPERHAEDNARDHHRDDPEGPVHLPEAEPVAGQREAGQHAEHRRDRRRHRRDGEAARERGAHRVAAERQPEVIEREPLEREDRHGVLREREEEDDRERHPQEEEQQPGDDVQRGAEESFDRLVADEPLGRLRRLGRLGGLGRHLRHPPVPRCSRTGTRGPSRPRWRRARTSTPRSRTRSSRSRRPGSR